MCALVRLADGAEDQRILTEADGLDPVGFRHTKGEFQVLEVLTRHSMFRVQEISDDVGGR